MTHPLTPAQKLARHCGDDLEFLTQSERYQLLLCAATYMHVYAELEEGESIDWPVEVCEDLVGIVVSDNVTACLVLFNVDRPEVIGELLPLIARCAQENFHIEGPVVEVDGEYVLAGLYEVLDAGGYI